MNKFLKWGLLLQIPNVIILIVFLINWVFVNVQKVSIPTVSFPAVNLMQIFWVVIGYGYALINIFSLIFVIVGLTTKE